MDRLEEINEQVVALRNNADKNRLKSAAQFIVAAAFAEGGLVTASMAPNRTLAYAIIFGISGANLFGSIEQSIKSIHDGQKAVALEAVIAAHELQQQTAHDS